MYGFVWFMRLIPGWYIYIYNMCVWVCECTSVHIYIYIMIYSCVCVFSLKHVWQWERERERDIRNEYAHDNVCSLASLTMLVAGGSWCAQGLSLHAHMAILSVIIHVAVSTSRQELRHINCDILWNIVTYCEILWHVFGLLADCVCFGVW